MRQPQQQHETIDAVTGEVVAPTSLAQQQHGERAQLAVGAVTALAMAAKEQAIVQARFARADIKPRNLNTVRQKLLEECNRPGFADEAMYEKPVGSEKITGLSIRFAEAALRVLGNVDCFADLIDQDTVQCFYRVGALDLETNAQFSETLTISKFIERSRRLEGQRLMGTRKNTRGQDVFIYLGTEDDVVVNIRKAVSKSRRNAILSLLPADIREECTKAIEITQRTRDAQDPTKARKAVVDAFYQLGIKVTELEEYLGHPVDLIKPEQFKPLRAIHAALKEGSTTWADVMAARADGPRKPQAPGPGPVPVPPPPAADSPAPPPAAESVVEAAPQDDSLLGRIARMTKEQHDGIKAELEKLPKAERGPAGTAFAKRRQELGL